MLPPLAPALSRRAYIETAAYFTGNENKPTYHSPKFSDRAGPARPSVYKCASQLHIVVSSARSTMVSITDLPGPSIYLIGAFLASGLLLVVRRIFDRRGII